MSVRAQQATDIGVFLEMIHGGEPDGYVELRQLNGHGARQRFFPVGDRAKVEQAIGALGQQADLFIGAAPRASRSGKREAVHHANVAWADLDVPEAIAALDAFEPAPSMVIHTGRGRHCYWSLLDPAPADQVEEANRRLALALDGDPACTDAARVLRPPGTMNYKHGRPVTVEIVNVECHHLADLLAALPEPAIRRARVAHKLDAGDALGSIAPPVYVEALAGEFVGRDGKIACPFHEDRTPSLHVYNEPERGWVCFGCGRGGTIIDFGAALYGIEPRGAGYREIRRRLAADLLGTL